MRNIQDFPCHGSLKATEAYTHASAESTQASQVPSAIFIEKGLETVKKAILRLLRQAKHDSAVAIVCFTVAFSSSTLWADNQIIPGNLGTSDPAPMIEGNTLYLYTTADAIGNGDLSIYDIQVHSTTDLVKWKDEGIALTEKNVPWAAQKGNLWAPHVIKLGGKYHLYFPANDGRVFRMGHAVSDKPTGPFIADATFMAGCGVDAIDPFAFYDSTTNKAYLAWNQVGSTPNQAYIAELNSTFSNVTGTVTNIRAGLGGNSQRYIEGIWIIKQNDLYYNIVADWTGSVESITYSTSTNLRGPYTYAGEILNMNANAATIHAGAVFFRNRWLIFYHTGGNEFGGTINTGTKRVTGI
ncbi:MAG TPA: family 43 glycosylhydrolase, partial [Candidatus Latescibacteria bacterium]|nr:family 43 glycosylhydrolase [Candidatus Latescibacterota bacterium]